MQHRLLISLVVTAASIMTAGLSWIAALLVFIPMMKTDMAILRIIVWLLSPVVVSLGFAVGYSLAARWLRGSRDRFVTLWLWPLVGCSAGAAAVFWFGPMLIVFGAFGGGTACIVLREILVDRRHRVGNARRYVG